MREPSEYNYYHPDDVVIVKDGSNGILAYGFRKRPEPEWELQAGQIQSHEHEPEPKPVRDPGAPLVRPDHNLDLNMGDSRCLGCRWNALYRQIKGIEPGVLGGYEEPLPRPKHTPATPGGACLGCEWTGLRNQIWAADDAQD